MEIYRNLSIKSKLATIALLTCITALALAGAALFSYEVQSFKRTLVHDLRAHATTLAGLSSAALTFDDTATVTEMLGELKSQEHIKWAVIFKDGTVFAQYVNPALDGMPPIQPPAAFGEEFGIDGLHLNAEISVKGERVGTIHLSADTSQLRSRLWEYGKILFFVFLASSFVALFLASRLQRAIVAPVRRLAEAAQLIAERQDYSVRVEQQGGDELGRLTAAFNQMLTRIQEQDTALRDSRERFEIAVAGARDGIWDWNLLSNEQYLSPQWKAMIGYTEDELTITHAVWVDLIHPDDRDGTTRTLAEYLEGKRPTYELEFRLRHKNGSYRWILSRGAALRGADGTPFRMAGSHTDITERKQAEEEIHIARKKFESLVNSINGIVWEADAQKSQVLFMNDQAERILGYPVKRWLDEPGFWAQSAHPDDRVATLRANRRGIAAGKPYRLEHRAVASDGRVVWLSESVSVEKQSDGSVLLRGLSIDITEQKLAAMQIAQMQSELVAASRLAGMAEVATGVLHNVGNVLNSVNVSVTVMVDQLRKSKTASLAKGVQLLREHKDNLAEYLTSDPKGIHLPAFFEAVSEQLLREQTALSHEAQGLQRNIEHIKQIVGMQQAFATVSGALEKIHMHELVEDALRMTASACVRRKIEITRRFDAVPEVLTDRHKVLQILVNLLHNATQALDARPTDRQITLRIVRVEHRRVRVEVTDNGVGIPPENLARIFNHGFTTKKTGHGFGLHSGAIAAKEMGGNLSVRSDGAGTGATFVLELPAERTAALPSLSSNAAPYASDRAA